MDKAQANQKIEQYLDAHKNEIIETLADLIRIPSVKQAAQPSMPFGKGVSDALAASLDHAQRLGFATTNLDNYIGWADYGAGSETLGIMAHVDVVPEGTGWRVEPYGAVIEGSRMLGRGTLDDKGPAIAALYGLSAVKQSGITLNKKVRLIFGCDEESGWADIDYYKKHEKMPEMGFSPDGDYPLVNSEKGILHADITASFEGISFAPKRLISIKGGTRANVVPPEATAIVAGCTVEEIEEAAKTISGIEVVTQKNGDEIYITVKGHGAHASTPEKGVNAITALNALVLKLPLAPCDGLKALQKLNERIPFGQYNGASAGVACSDDKSGALTLSLGIMEMDEESMSAVIDIRYPVTYHYEQILDQLDNALSPLGVSVRTKQAPHFVEESSPLVQSLLKVYAEKTGLEPYCIAIGGGTYARAIEGAVTFGCAFPGKEQLMHQPNEFIDLDELLLDAKIIAAAIVEICA